MYCEHTRNILSMRLCVTRNCSEFRLHFVRSNREYAYIFYEMHIDITRSFDSAHRCISKRNGRVKFLTIVLR